jgi:tetratricopeptide (TPR) repeat protein
VASLEADVAANPANLKTRLRLAKAYYYSLDVDRAAGLLTGIAKEAPHLEGIHEMLVEVYTLQGDSDKLIEALKAQIERTTEEQARRKARWRLVDELLAAGKNDEALTTVKDLGDPRDPQSYARIGTLLQYFGHYDDAIVCLQKAKASTRQQYNQDQSDFSVAQAMVLQGDIPGAAAKIMDAVADQSKQQVQYGGVYGMYEGGANPFQAIEPVFVLYPKLAEEVTKLLDARREAAPTDPQLIKLAMALNKSLGRPDKSEELLQKTVEAGGSDQKLVAQQIDLALRRKDFAKAIELAEKFIAQQPKAKLTPGMPAQYAGYAALQSPRTFMLCKLGDVYWDMGQKDKAFDTYKQIIDEKIDQTKTAYATICMVRGRTKEASDIIEAALAAQEVKPPMLLQMRAEIAALDGKPEVAFDAIAEAAQHETPDADPYGGRGGGSAQILSNLAQLCGMTDKFAAFIREKIKKNPLDWDSYSNLAESYWQAGRPTEALAVLDEADKQPALAQQVLNLRMQWVRHTATLDELIVLQQKQIELSEKDVDTDTANPYSRYRGNSNEDSSARDELGSMLWEKGEKEHAVQVWTERSNAQKAETYVRLSQLYQKQGAFDEAEKALGRAVELDPDNANTRRAIAEQLYSRGDRKAMLPHMLEAFNQTAGADQSSRYSYGYDAGYGNESTDPSKMNQWAAALCADPEITTYLASPEALDHGGEYRTMLSALTGDWAGLETSLSPRVTGGSHDPVVWTLWAKVQQRKGDWAEAAKALSYLKRSKLTTISQHRDRLKLVLAGKQYKEAAAGQRQAPPGAGMQAQNPGSQYSQSYYGGYGGYWDQQQGSDLLPSIFIKLGDATKAERFYLISGGGDGVETRLPALASLMWDQGAKDRALELMRLALLAPSGRYGGGRNMIPQYAGMLAESGKVQEAIDLLVRSYRWDSSAERDDMYQAIYGRSGSDESIERGQSDSVGGSLYELLMRRNLFDQTLKKLSEESAQNPKDPKLAQLVISLEKRAGRWAELRQSLAGWRAARPDDVGMNLEEFHAACQLQQWDDALKVLEEIRKDAPDKPERWTLHEAFVRFLQNDADKTAAAVEPLLKADAVSEGGEADSAQVLLMCLNRLDKVVAKLEDQKRAGELDDQRKPQLFRLYAATGKRQEAATLALEELWKQSQELSAASPWYRSLCSLAGDGGAAITPGTARPADAALLALINRGPQEGIKAFTPLTQGDTPTVEAMRGLVFAAELAGDDALAVQANSKLLTWLEPRRFTTWYSDARPELQRLAKKAIDQANRAGMLQVAMSGSAGNQLSEALSQSQGRAAVHLYEPMYTAYQKLNRSLLARAGKAEELRVVAKRQGRSLSDDQEYNRYNRYGQYYNQYSAYARYAERGSDQSFQGTDWQTVVRQSLWNAGRADLLSAEYKELGPRVGRPEWGVVASVAAATGEADAAKQWRLKRAEALLASLEASDTPDLGSSTRDPWRWYYGYSSAAQDVDRIRQALMVTVTDDYQRPENKSLLQGEADQLWELAIIEPSIEKKLLEAEKGVGRGWGTTRTFQQLLPYYKAKGDSKKIIELVERAYETDRITSCPLLDQYVWACYREKAFDKLDNVFAAAMRVGSTMRNDVDIARVMALRGAGKDAQADEIESRLLASVVHETPNKHRLRADLVQDVSIPSAGYDYSYEGFMSPMPIGMYGGRNSYWRNGSSRRYVQPGTDFSTIVEVASALGVRYDSSVRPENVTVAALRSAYQRQGMHARAAALLDREIPETPDIQDRMPLMSAKATELFLAKKTKEATQAATELETALRNQVKSQPGDADPLIDLARLYMSDAYGQNWAKASEALGAALKIDPSRDAAKSLAVHSFYKQKKFAEALGMWRSAQRGAGQNVRASCYSAPTLFYAALSAGGAGDKDLGQSLARQAVFMYPTHALVAQTQELTR